MIPSSYPKPKEISRLTAKMLLEIKAIHFNSKEPFVLASGMPSPTYIDCRKIISFPRVRSTLMDFLTITVMRNVGFEAFDNIAGGETAGIPFASFFAERLGLPMIYIRKNPKGYGRNSSIEGIINKKDRVLLVEDLATDGGSKINFINKIRESGATCEHTAVIFFYKIFSQTSKIMKKNNIKLHYLCNWWDIIKEAKRTKTFDAATISEVEKYLSAPEIWQDQNKIK